MAIEKEVSDELQAIKNELFELKQQFEAHFHRTYTRKGNGPVAPPDIIAGPATGKPLYK